VQKAAQGLLDSARALGATLLEMAGTRAELALLELREDAERRLGILVLQAAAGVFLAFGLLLATLFVVAFFWDTHRLAAIAAMSVLYFAVAFAVLAVARSRRNAAPPPLDVTRSELAADARTLRGEA
jgi:uncharacterized membrane protein YqjE